MLSTVISASQTHRVVAIPDFSVNRENAYFLATLPNEVNLPEGVISREWLTANSTRHTNWIFEMETINAICSTLLAPIQQ